jgi:hypothetical protein
MHNTEIFLIVKASQTKCPRCFYVSCSGITPSACDCQPESRPPVYECCVFRCHRRSIIDREGVRTKSWTQESSGRSNIPCTHIRRKQLLYRSTKRRSLSPQRFMCLDTQAGKLSTTGSAKKVSHQRKDQHSGINGETA